MEKGITVVPNQKPTLRLIEILEALEMQVFDLTSHDRTHHLL